MLMILNTGGYSDFVAATQAVLKFLHERLGFDLWMVTRVIEGDWIVLQAEDHGYGVKGGDVFRWVDSFCSQMVCGNGPYIAVNSSLVPAYVEAPINQQVKIGAYIGIPLCQKNGNLFGTLCAIHPEPVAESIATELPLLEILANMLSSFLEADLKTQHERRRAERAEADALMDDLTGLYNRRGWNTLLEKEESRCKDFGLSACILIIDLDNLKHINDSFGHSAGDELLKRLATALKSVLRKEDIAARIGGDEFAILGIETDAAGAQTLTERLRIAFMAAQVKASIGLAVRSPTESLMLAWRQADAEMYRQKRIAKFFAVPINPVFETGTI